MVKPQNEFDYFHSKDREFCLVNWMSIRSNQRRNNEDGILLLGDIMQDSETKDT